MERLRLKQKDAEKALASLEAVLKVPFSEIVRDAAIQRFEYTFEAFWKFAQESLKVHEGRICASPKACFRELFSAGILTEKETERCLIMTDKRNETSHTYKEKVAKAIYKRLGGFCSLMKKGLARVKKRYSVWRHYTVAPTFYRVKI
ncbi:MAG: nucleotidyltransferase substrate binding protein [Elusimicrobia bacterium]|nr:nucleotidyltransferase substrate binding protein [Elusimicrobiota bacterium]